MPESRTYRSKIDAWLLGVVIAGLAVPLAMAARSPATTWLMLFLLLPVVLLFAWLCLATRYTVQGDVLRVHAGLYTLRIPLGDITRVQPTRDPLASPALSLDRLEILYGKGKRVLVSPKDKAGFLKDIGFGGSA